MGFKTLNIGTTGLVTSKFALDTTGQNIANASTPGYSRQRVVTQANNPQQYATFAIGSGVGVKSVKRIADEFLEKQVRLANGTENYLDTMETGYENIQVFFNELTDNDISSMMNQFWDAASDLANNVEDVSTRRALIENGKNLRDSFQSIDKKLFDYRLRQNEAVVDMVGDVNSIITQIAGLNTDILKTESGGTTGVVANDLRDQRGELLKELGGMMDITVTEQDNGSVTVTQKSRMLVFENQHFDLSTRSIQSGDMLIDVPVFAEDEEEVTLTDGTLAAMVDLRDNVLLGYKDDVDQLAASFMWEFNRVHSQSIGLDGFTNLTGTTSVIDPAVTLDNLAYDFTPVSGTYQIENGNFEIVVHDAESDTDTVLNIEVDLDNRNPTAGDPTIEPDTILYDPANPGATNALVNKMQAAFDSIRPGLFQVSLDLANHLVVDSLSTEHTFSFGRDTSGVLAAMGMNTFFDGYDAGTFEVNKVVEDNPEYLAAAKSFTPGNNEGALAMLDLRETAVLDGDTSTLDDYYEGIIGRLGIEGARIISLHETQQDILVRMENQRESLSGVNLDEELTKMIQFQRSFQSSARFISTADTILETLINM